MTINPQISIRQAEPKEFEFIGNLMVKVYSNLDGFPKPKEMPAYYEFLQNVGALTSKDGVEIVIAEKSEEGIVGAVVYFASMEHYGAGGEITKIKHAAAFRLLAVDPSARGLGIGKLLTQACLQMAEQSGLNELIIHSTKVMKTAWAMYEHMGFEKASDLDFMQGELKVYGFRYLF